jgi:hypothetical protein
MIEHDLRATGTRPAGYSALIARFQLDVIPNWHQSDVAPGNTHRIATTAGMTEEVYPARYWPGDTLGDHLEFALKYDGTNLAILASVFKAAPLEEVRQYVASAPRGKYSRRLWFLYEMLYALQEELGLTPGGTSAHSSNCFPLLGYAWVGAALDGEWAFMTDASTRDWVDNYPDSDGIGVKSRRNGLCRCDHGCAPVPLRLPTR